MKSSPRSYSDHRGDTTQAARADARVVQQLMFNRILSFARLLAVEGVTIVGFDAATGTFVGSLAGVNFVVNVGLAEKKAQRGAVS